MVGYDCCHYYTSILMTEVQCSILNDWTTILMDQVFETIGTNLREE